MSESDFESSMAVVGVQLISAAASISRYSPMSAVLSAAKWTS